MKMQTKTKLRETEIGMIPEEWEIKKLVEVTEQIFSGGTPNTRKLEYWNGNISWLSSGETKNRFIHSTKKKITELGVKNSSVRLAKFGDVLIASAGQGHTRGQTSFCMIDTYINQSMVALRAKKEKLKPLFLFYYLLSRYPELRNISDAHSSRGSLTNRLLAELNVPIPPIIEQDNISRILFSIDSKIELNQQMNKTIELICKTIFKHWFVDFEFPNEKNKPYKSSEGLMVHNTELERNIPKGWEDKTLGNLGKIICGKTPPKSNKEFFGGNISFIKIPDMHNQVFVSNTEDSLTEEGKKYQENTTLPIGAICVSCIATVGLVSITGKESQTNQQINSIIPYDEHSRYYLYFIMKSMKKDLENIGSGGSTTLNINTNSFSNIKIIYPDQEIMTKFDQIVKPLFAKLLSNSIESKNLSQIHNLLLPKLMSGKIRVPIEAR